MSMLIHKVTTDWRRFVLEQEETDLTEIITSEKLKAEETRKFVANAFRDGALKTTEQRLTSSCPLYHALVVAAERRKSKELLKN